jgi:putative FmdB family regulatory protein
MVTTSAVIDGTVPCQTDMPTYEYRCKKGHTFEVVQRMIDDPVEVCPRCGAEVQRVFHPIAVHFKGKGFYNTDYGTKKRAREKETADASAKSGAISDSSSSSSDKKDAKPADKPAAKEKKPASGTGSGTSKPASK